MTVSEYSHLKQQIISAINNHSEHSKILNTLKELFKESINSVRRFEQIKSIGQLLKVLELRGVLSEDDVGCLRDISRKIPGNTEVMLKVVEYDNMPKRRIVGNYYLAKHEIPPQSKSATERLTGCTKPVSNMNDVQNKQRIFERIIEEIGSYWKNLARNLDIRECEIDKIDFENTTLRAKVTLLLERFDYKADPQKWFFILCDALEKSRRKDLVKSIQEIMPIQYSNY